MIKEFTHLHTVFGIWEAKFYAVAALSYWCACEPLATMTVELDLERMEKMKQEVLQLIQNMIDEYGNVSVIELEMALVEGLAKVREIGMQKTEDKSEDVV